MAVYKRHLSKGLFYYYKFDLNGKTYKSKTEYKTKLEAKKAESIKMIELSEVVNTNESEILLKELISERLEYLKTMKSSKYLKENKYYFNLLSNFLGINVKVIEVSKKDIIKVLLEYSNKQKNDGFDNYSVNSMLRIVKALFNFGIDYLNIKMENPCNKINPFPVEKKLKYIPTDNEIEAVLELCTPRQKDLLIFVRDTYCRINEALNLKYKDIGTDYVVLYTRKSRNGNLVYRKVPKPICLENLKILDNEERVFNEWAKEPKFLHKKIKKLGQYSWNWHNLRHRGASLMRSTPL